jgi:hypothetical protein
MASWAIGKKAHTHTDDRQSILRKALRMVCVGVYVCVCVCEVWFSCVYFFVVFA